jgi:hypothetical protein
MALAIPERDYPSALANTMVVAERCTLELPIGDRRVYQMPELPLPPGRTLAEQLRVQAYAGLGKRYPGHDALWRRALEVAADLAGAPAPAPDLPLDDVWLGWRATPSAGAAPGATANRTTGTRRPTSMRSRTPCPTRPTRSPSCAAASSSSA